MDSIFQIKINQNKLQKILNDLSAQQYQQHQQLKKIEQKLSHQAQVHEKMKKQLIVKIQSTGCKVQDYINGIQQKIQHLQQMTNEIQKKNTQQVQSTIEKIKMIQQHNGNKQQFIQGFKKDVQNEFKKITQIIQKNQYQKSENGILIDQPNAGQAKNRNLVSKYEMRLNALEAQTVSVNKILQIVQDQNLLYFLHYLVDKQVGMKAVVETMKESVNPFNYQSPQEKVKRYNQLKNNLISTQNKMEDMKTQYVGLYNNTFQSTKQNRQENHLHYALLSTKIKQLQNKFNQQQMKAINPDQPQKILYPSNLDIFNRKEKFKNINKSIRSQNQSEHKNKQVGIFGSNDEFQKFKCKMSEENNKLLQRLANLQDKIWSACNKIQQAKQISKVVKNDVDKINEKIKILNHYSHFGGEKDMLNFKTIGEFIYQFRSIQDSIEQKMKHMVDIKNFNKNIQQICQKVKIVNEVAQAKANKDQTRRAFNFIQEKIKQIVTLIAEMQCSNKKAAGRKKLMQCMSCDDNFFQETHVQRETCDPTFTLTRATTSRNPSSFNIKFRERAKQKMQI